MARMRMLKPGFFTNDLLAEITPLGRLLFQSLWCLADRSGRLEDRPRKIKAEALPYDDCDVDALLNDLASRGFILRYEHGGARYIEVLKFAKHQTPHVKEPASTIPSPELHDTSTVQAPGLPDTGTMPAPPETETETETDPQTPEGQQGGEAPSTASQSVYASEQVSPQEETGSDPPPQPRPPRKDPDGAAKALVRAFRSVRHPRQSPDPSESEFRSIRAVARSMATSGCTPEDVVRLTTAMTRKFPDSGMWTLPALARNWSALLEFAESSTQAASPGQSNGSGSNGIEAGASRRPADVSTIYRDFKDDIGPLPAARRRPQ